MEDMSAAAHLMKAPLFTIEQIELIRRLRNSGITKDQVVQAFEELERMDLELGRTFNVPTSSLNCGSNSSSNSSTPASAGTVTTTTTASAAAASAISSSSGHNATTATASLINPFTYLQLQHHLLRQLTAAAHLNSSGNHGDLNADAAIPRSPSQNSESPPNTPQGVVQHMSGGYLLTPSLPRSVNGHHESYIEDQVELQEFIKQGDAAILEEIRKFVMRYNIKQHFIAEMAKISQAYVSRYFRGETSEMSDRTKIAIYSWYLTCKKNPWKLKQICPNSGVKRMVSDSGDLIPLKRERFTFKSAHLTILEKYYNVDPYPDSQTREQIVEECNRAMNRDLTEREKVTINVVTNWFNNRRKEAKQKLRLQGTGKVKPMMYINFVEF
ncbi:Homeobox-containing protein 1 [Chamberlinius hualienensis]